MSTRMSFWLAVLLLLAAAGLRLSQLASLPPGFQPDEIIDIQIANDIRRGQIEVFYDLGSEGREALYHTVLAVVTSLTGGGMIGYHILSVWAGMLMLAVVYALAARLYGPLPGVAAMGLLAVGFFPVLLSRSISRETFVPLLVAAAMLAIARAFPVYQQNRRNLPPSTLPFASLGLVLGLAFYTHPVSFAITLASIAFIIYMLLSRQPMGSRTLNYASFAVLVLMIIIMPYLISSIRRPDLAGADRLLTAYSSSAQPWYEKIVAVLGGVFVVGDQNPIYNLRGRPLMDVFSGLLVIIGIVTAARYWRLPRYALSLIVIVALLPSALLAANSPYFPSYAALLPILALFFSIGVKTIYSNISRDLRRYAIAGLLGLVIFNIIWTLNDLFYVWRDLPEVRAAYSAEINALAGYLDRTADDIPTLICAPSLSPYRTPVEGWTPTDLLLQMMHRSDDQIRYADCLSGFIITNGGARQQIALPDSTIESSMEPALQTWLSEGTPAVSPGLRIGSVYLLDVESVLADTVGRFTTTSIVSYAPEANAESVTAPLPLPFGGNITFLGYEPNGGRTYQPGDTVTVISYWRVDGVLPPDLLLFTHLLSDPAAIAVQRDVISVRADHLEPRDVFIQTTYIQLPLSMPPGFYRISIGAYQNRDEQRMVVLQNGEPRGDRIFLDFIIVTDN